MDEIVIVAAARTGVGKFGGTLAKIPATELGAHVIKGLLAQTGLDPALISESSSVRCSPRASAKTLPGRR